MGRERSSGRGHSITMAVAAAGNSQGTATALIQGTSQVSTVEVGEGCVLPILRPGEIVVVYNQGDNPLSVYPPVGGSIRPLSTNVAAPVNVESSVWFISLSDGSWIATPATPTLNSPLYIDDDGAWGLDSDAAGLAILGSVPVVNHDMSGILALMPSTGGDWNPAISYADSYVSILGKIAVLVVTISGSATFSTAAGNLLIQNFPFLSKASGQHLTASGLTGFSGFNAPPTTSGEPIGVYGRFNAGNQITLGFNRLNTTPAAITISNLASGVPFSLTLMGAVLTT